MPKVYIHLSGHDVADTLLQVEKDGYVKPSVVENPLKPCKCPRCKTENNPSSNFCNKCAMPLDEAAFIKKETDLISDPIDLLSKMKEYTSNYESLVNGIWDMLSLEKIMKNYSEITKDQLREKLKIDNFDRLYNDWLSSGLIKANGNNITFPESSKQLVKSYVDFWGGRREST